MPLEAWSRSSRSSRSILVRTARRSSRSTLRAGSAVGTYSYAISPGVSDRIRTSSTTVVPAGAPLPPFDSSDGPIPLQPFNSSTNTFRVHRIVDSDHQCELHQPSRQQPHGHGEHLLDQRQRPVHLLDSPDNTSIILFDGPQTQGRGPTPQNFINTTFEDSASRIDYGRCRRAVHSVPSDTSPSSRCRSCRASRSTVHGPFSSRTRAKEHNDL